MWWFKRRTKVYLYCKVSNEQYKTYVNTDSNGVKWAYVYPSSKVGHVILNDDGSTTGESCYIQQWSCTPFDLMATKNARYAT